MSTIAPDLGRLLIIASRTAREAMDVAADACGVPLADLAAPGRSRARVAYARQIAMYLAHVVGHMSLTEVSIVFERDRTTVAHACHAIEDRRESPIFDKQMEQIEAVLRARIRALLEKRRLHAAAPLADPEPVPMPVSGTVSGSSALHRAATPALRRRPQSR